jgi:hypothetical protein
MIAADRRISPELEPVLTRFIDNFYLTPFLSRWRLCVALSAEFERRNIDLHIAPPAAEALLP